MTGDADLHIGNAVHLHRWSLTGTGGATRSRRKCSDPDCDRPISAGADALRQALMTPAICRNSRANCQHGIPMTKATPKSP
jgi:hypothetical protein